MFYYLLCSTPCAVKLDGAFIGKATENYSIIDSEGGLIEFLPTDQSYGEITFLPSENYNSTKDVKVFNLGKEGKLVIPVFKRKLFSDFKLIGRREISFYSGKVYLTCYQENGIRLICENSTDMQVESVPFYPDEILMEKTENSYGAYLLVFLLGKRTMIVGYRITKTIELVFKTACDSYKFNGNRLTVTEFKADALKHIVSTVWAFDKEVKAIEKTVIRKKDIYSVNPALIPYAFFQEVALQGDYYEFLTPRLKPRSEEIKSFLGRYTYILPPPHFKSKDLVTLIYEDKIKYARPTYSKGLIDNVSLYEADEI